MMALNMTMASHGLHPALTLVDWLSPDLLQAAAECFPRNDGIDLHQGIMLGIQSGVAILDIEKAHLALLENRRGQGHTGDILSAHVFAPFLRR